MRILALDSSGLVASVAVVEDEQTVAEYTVNYKKTHSQTLLPMLDEVAKMIELDLKEVDAIAVAGGPGSFTGLRIGSATAKGWAWRFISRWFMCRPWKDWPIIYMEFPVWYVRSWMPEESRFIQGFILLIPDSM